MRINIGFLCRTVACAFVLLITAAIAVNATAMAQPQDKASKAYGGDLAAATAHQSFIRVEDNGGGPIRKNIKIGLGKSVLIEFPHDVRDVMVSNPSAVDAVVLSSNRVFLLARKIGEANAFFFDTSGAQFATMELYVERETAGLESLLNRLIIGSHIKVEMLNQTVVLTGSVQNPTDSVRASDLARQFASVDYDVKDSGTEGVSVAKAAKSETESVINMLVVEAEEQVMLKVTVAEVQRTALKQLGVNLGGMLQSGGFSTTLLTDNALPLTAAQGLGLLPTFGLATAASGACAAGQMCVYNPGPGSSSVGNSGLISGWSNGGNTIQSAIRALERDGLIKTLAEPNLTAVSGEPAEFLAGGEVPYVLALIRSPGPVRSPSRNSACS